MIPADSEAHRQTQSQLEMRSIFRLYFFVDTHGRHLGSVPKIRHAHTYLPTGLPNEKPEKA